MMSVVECFALSALDNLSEFDKFNLSRIDKVVNNEKVTSIDNAVIIRSMETFGEKFKKWRKSKGVSQTLIMKRVGIAESNISNMEAGRRPPSDNDLEKLASMPELEIDLKTLRMWKYIEKIPPDVLEAIKENRSNLETVTQELKTELIKRQTGENE